MLLLRGDGFKWRLSVFGCRLAVVGSSGNRQDFQDFSGFKGIEVDPEKSCLFASQTQD
jgi:hypothetical protein